MKTNVVVLLCMLSAMISIGWSSLEMDKIELNTIEGAAPGDCACAIENGTCTKCIYFVPDPFDPSQDYSVVCEWAGVSLYECLYTGEIGGFCEETYTWCGAYIKCTTNDCSFNCEFDGSCQGATTTHGSSPCSS